MPVTKPLDLSCTEEQEAMVEEFSGRKNVSRAMALRFLLGRKWDQDRAESLLENYLKLKEEKHYQQIDVAQILDELRTEKLVILGSKARDKSSILLIDALKHVPGEFSDESTLRLSFYMAELITLDIDTQRDGITVLCNMDGLSWQQSDYAFYRDVVQLFQNNFPCRVKNIIAFKPPWWIKTLIRFVSPFMKAKMRDRIHVIVGERESLTEWIASDALPVELGGSYKYDHGEFLKLQMTKASTARMTGILKGEEEAADLDNIPLDEPSVIDDPLAKELSKFREQALQADVSDLPIGKRKASTEEMRPLNLARLARSRAARMTMSLPDAMPSSLITTPATETNQETQEDAVIDVETVDSKMEDEEKAGDRDKIGFLNLAEDRDDEDEMVDVTEIDDNPVNVPPRETVRKSRPPKRRGGRKERPRAVQL